MNRTLSALREYRLEYPEEAQGREFEDLIRSEGRRAWLRERSDGHVTGSCFLLNSSLTEVLLMYHVKLQRWLQLGGHGEDDESEVVDIAIREAREEAGVDEVFELSKDRILDLDKHLIPSAKGVPQHFHYDIRYLFYIASGVSPVGSSESTELRWVKLEELKGYLNEESTDRVVGKIKTVIEQWKQRS